MCGQALSPSSETNRVKAMRCEWMQEAIRDRSLLGGCLFLVRSLQWMTTHSMHERALAVD